MDLMKTEYQENLSPVDARAIELGDYFLEHVREEHVLDSFAFDTNPVSTQYAAVEAAMGTYFDPLIFGLVDDVDASLEAFRSALDAAGVQDVLKEMQKQVDEFAASKN